MNENKRKNMLDEGFFWTKLHLLDEKSHEWRENINSDLKTKVGLLFGDDLHLLPLLENSSM